MIENVAEKKAFLKQYVELKREAMQTEELFAAVEADIAGIKATEITGMPKGKGGFHSVTESSAIKRNELKKMLDAQRDEMLKVCVRIEKAIMTLDNPTQRQLMKYRYIMGMKWELICVKMYYNWDSVHRIHRKALHNIRIESYT